MFCTHGDKTIVRQILYLFLVCVKTHRGPHSIGGRAAFCSSLEKATLPHPPPPVPLRTIPGHGLPLQGFVITHTGHTTLGRTPLDEWSARRRDRYLITHIHNSQTSMPRRDSNPRGHWDWSAVNLHAVLASWLTDWLHLRNPHFAVNTTSLSQCRIYQHIWLRHFVSDHTNVIFCYWHESA
jgi:hypothetical protein